jgi:hypothetical protein
LPYFPHFEFSVLTGIFASCIADFEKFILEKKMDYENRTWSGKALALSVMQVLSYLRVMLELSEYFSLHITDFADSRRKHKALMTQHDEEKQLHLKNRNNSGNMSSNWRSASILRCQKNSNNILAVTNGNSA